VAIEREVAAGRVPVAAGGIGRLVARRARSRSLGSAGLVLAVVGVFAAGAALSPTFLVLSNLQNIMLNVSILGILALGQTLVMLLRQVDLSMGSLMAFGPIAAVQLTELIYSTPLFAGGNYVVAGATLIMVLTIVVSMLVGALNGVLTVKGGVPALIVTLGMLYALRGAGYTLSGGDPLYFTDLGRFMWLGTAKLGLFPVPFLLFLGIGALAMLVLKFTRVGPAIYATGGNEKAAVYSGVSTGKWKLIAFVFAGFCSGVAALIYSSRLGSVEAAQASGYELSAIAIAVIGGTTLQGGRGTMLGTVLASIALAGITNIITLKGVVSWYQTIIIGVIIVAAAFAYLGKGRRHA
jgi:ribose transport system permease protein